MEQSVGAQQFAIATAGIPPEEILFGSSEAAAHLEEQLRAMAQSDVPVLLEGEAGTGKELTARWLHSLSPYAQGRFIKASCFGAERDEACSVVDDRGAWEGHGSLREMIEQLEQAGPGTLFLDDVENLAQTTQALLARLLEERSSRNGLLSTHGETLADVRIVSATRLEMRAGGEAGVVRPEFFHSISGFTARILPLRERLEDLPQLVRYMVGRHSEGLGLKPHPLSGRALRVLAEYRWPRNFQELDQMLTGYVLTGSEDMLVEKVRALSRSGEISDEVWMDPPPGLEGLVRAPRVRMRNGREVIDDEAILRALRENCWNRRQTAGRLRMSYRSLLNRLKKIDASAGQAAAARG